MKSNHKAPKNFPACLFLVLFSTLLVSCASFNGATSNTQQKNENVLMLKFQEGEPGVDPYVTRMLVANNFLRMDEGSDQDDFTLFDRKGKTIYSVTHENKSILVIPDSSVKGTWVNELKLEEKSIVDMKAPLVSGKRPQQIELFVNGNLCKRMAVVPGLHVPAIKALREFHQVLASEHMRNMGKTPMEMQEPCFLAYEVRNPDKVFQFGFPIQEQDYSGKTRVLLDYNPGFSVNPSVFLLPKGYREFMSSDMQ